LFDGAHGRPDPGDRQRSHRRARLARYPGPGGWPVRRAVRHPGARVPLAIGVTLWGQRVEHADLQVVGLLRARLQEAQRAARAIVGAAATEAVGWLDARHVGALSGVLPLPQ